MRVRVGGVRFWVQVAGQLCLVLVIALVVEVSMAMNRRPGSNQNVMRLEAINFAIVCYQNVHGTYPEAGMGDGLTEASLRENNRRLAALLVAIDGDNFAPGGRLMLDGLIVDTNGHFFRYRPAATYPFDAKTTVGIDGENPPNRDTYQLWSVGRDGIDQRGAKGSDDITNWKKQ